MIYVQMRNRAKVRPGEALTLGQIARVMGPADAASLPVPCPKEPGVWKLEAITAAQVLTQRYTGMDITLLGADICYVHRLAPEGRDLTRPLRTAAAFLILLLGSALGLCWFHADVNMPEAQAELFAALTGSVPKDSRLITIPYCIGVALGVAVFYALPSRKATTPLEVKLTEYQEDMEKTEGKDID